VHLTIDSIYDLVGILTALGGLIALYHSKRRERDEVKVRQTVAIERNTEATERLSTVVEKMADKMESLDKRVDRLDWKVFGH
jgi:hypothetical protein